MSFGRAKKNEPSKERIFQIFSRQDEFSFACDAAEESQAWVHAICGGIARVSGDNMENTARGGSPSTVTAEEADVEVTAEVFVEAVTAEGRPEKVAAGSDSEAVAAEGGAEAVEMGGDAEGVAAEREPEEEGGREGGADAGTVGGDVDVHPEASNSDHDGDCEGGRPAVARLQALVRGKLSRHGFYAPGRQLELAQSIAVGTGVGAAVLAAAQAPVASACPPPTADVDASPDTTLGTVALVRSRMPSFSLFSRRGPPSNPTLEREARREVGRGSAEADLAAAKRALQAAAQTSEVRCP